MPHIDGIETFSGKMLHSSAYKDASIFKGKRVLVLGCGESGMDIAYRAVHQASEAAISIRNGMLAVPHDGWGGLPLDTLICNVAEHSYEHWWCHKHHLKWRLTTFVIRIMFFLSSGTSTGYNQWVGRVKRVERGHHILCKSVAALPYMNRPVKQKSWRRFIWWWAEPEVDRSIYSYPAVSSISGSTVTFSDGRAMDVDVLVYATGYTQSFPFLPKSANSRKEGLARGDDASLPSDHLIIEPDEPTLAFIGFVRPNVGAIPPMSELQVMWWIERMRGNIPAKRERPSYGLLGRKLVYGVDYGNYMHQVASEFGASPTLTTLCRSPCALAAYCLGQAYISFFKLQGPFESAAAWRVSRTELLQPVIQRGLAANVIFVVTMLAFGWVSLVALCVELVCTGARKIARSLGV
uniref:Flavin-containing monooxygenase n=2 Tax=Coccolithus braarudii TaxID=221442 RepID=A0A7S0LD88_9EUKA|mmetsp:Transcript_34044/g.72674  ORF Transcript_34044/g.72674 Transcript_34044/m.72674 type:complete len:407 (+) Transcript_34044:90-1310(+)